MIYSMSRRGSNVQELKRLVEKLRTYRLKHHLTEQALAQRLGVTFVTVNRWLNHRTMPSELYAYRIQRLLGERKRT